MKRLDFAFQRLTPLHSPRRGLPFMAVSALGLASILSAAMSPCLLGLHPC